MADICGSALNLAVATAESQKNWELVIDLLQAKQNEIRRRYSNAATERDRDAAPEDRTNATA